MKFFWAKIVTDCWNPVDVCVRVFKILFVLLCVFSAFYFGYFWYVIIEIVNLIWKALVVGYTSLFVGFDFQSQYVSDIVSGSIEFFASISTNSHSISYEVATKSYNYVYDYIKGHWQGMSISMLIGLTLGVIKT